MPKIHFCWLGKGSFPYIEQKCLELWKRILPDYEIICWNEDRFDVNYIFLKSSF